MNRRTFFVGLSAAALVACGKSGGGRRGSVPSNPRPSPPPLPTEAPVNRLRFGLVSHQLDGQARGELRDLGVRQVRITLYWDHWVKADYREQWSAEARLALAQGFELLVVVHAISDQRLTREERIQTMGRFGAFVAARAAEFPEVQAWQLWNEMDVGFTDVFGAYSGLPLRERGELYGIQMELAYPLIKQASPDALVVTGGLAHFDREMAFLAGLLDAGPLLADVAAIHCYGEGSLAQAVEGRLALTRAALGGWFSGPVWVTEVGQEGSDERQMQQWGTVIGSRFEVPRVYGYCLRDSDQGHGLLRTDGSRRPAGELLRAWHRGL